MSTRIAIVPMTLCAFLIAGLLCSTVTPAAPAASVSDLTDYITRIGGWFFEIDANGNPAKARDLSAEYWVQMSYAASTGAGSNLTTIKMTEYGQQREDSKGVCSTENVVTETVLIDLRELQTAKVTVTTTTVDILKSAKVWLVNLTMTGEKPLIRVVRQITPPTIVGFSAGASATAPGTGTSATCPGLRYGQQIKATTEQSDVSSYAILFASEKQAKYLQMLITGAGPSLNPPDRKTLRLEGPGEPTYVGGQPWRRQCRDHPRFRARGVSSIVLQGSRARQTRGLKFLRT